MARLTGITLAAKAASGRSQRCEICPVKKKYKVCNPETLRICSDSFQEGFKKGAKFANERSFDFLEKKAVALLNENFGRNLTLRLNKLEEEVNELKNELVDFSFGDNVLQDIIDEMGDVLIISAQIANLIGKDLSEILSETISKVEIRKTDPNYKRDETSRNKHNRQNQ